MTTQKNYIGISRDHSASMSHLKSAAMADYNSTVASIQALAEREKLFTSLAVARCGVTLRGYGVGCDFETKALDIYSAEQLIYGRALPYIPPLTHYSADGGGTPLFDSIGMLIEEFERRHDANDPNVSFLIMAITDGEENRSMKWSATKLRAKIAELEAKGNWTFTFRVPRGYKEPLVRQFHISPDNVLEWEQTTKGMEQATQVTHAAFDNYYTARSRGVRSTAKFFADTSKLTTQAVASALDDISSEVSIWQVPTVRGKTVIKEFVESLGRTYVQGQWFYELVKPEKHVQDYKTLVIRDRNNGKTYSGVQARRLLGLPDYGDISLEPGRYLNNYQVFIQSTSVNRILPNNSHVLYWPKVRAYA